MQAPFLELAFYVGLDRVNDALAAIVRYGTRNDPSGRGRIIDLEGREEEALISYGCAIVRTEAADFCGPPGFDMTPLVPLGRQVYTGFIGVAPFTQCLYGAILVEYTLQDPEQLRSNPRSLAFRNFYLGRSRLPPTLITKVLTQVPREAYVHEFDHGVYVSMSRELNPESRSVEDEQSMYISAAISKTIGEALTPG